MPEPTKPQIEARLRAVEEENRRLRAAMDENTQLRASTGAVASEPRAHTRGRAFLGMTLIVLATLLAPLATAVGFAARQASDTDTFVSTVAPLADDPAVQALIVDEATAAINDALEIDALVEELLDNVFDEGATPRLADAADLLGPLLADQARAAIRSALTRVVESDGFSSLWEQALRLTHTQFVAVMDADPDGAVAIDDSGVVAIQLQPIIAELKPALVVVGFTLAESIPEIDVSITVAEVPAVARARLGYSVVTAVGGLLPWLALTLLVIGVLVHPRRARAVVVAGALLLLTGAVLGGAIVIGGSVAGAALAGQLPPEVMAAVYGELTRQPSAVMLAFVVFGAVAIVAGLVSGASDRAAAARHSGATLLARATAALDKRGWRPESIPSALRRHGWLIWVWLGVVFLLLFATLRPLTPWGVVLGAAVLGVAAALYGVLQGSPSGEDAPTPVAEDSVAAEELST